MKKSNGLLACVITCMILFPLLGQAEDWSPENSIRLRIGFDAGGSTDVSGRLVAASVEENTGWNVVVENKPGGGGVAMMAALMTEKPDGLTLGIGVSVPIHLTLAKRGDTVPFKIDSFDYIATISGSENAMVARGDAPFNNFMEFLAYAKAEGSVAVGYDANPQQMILNAVSKQADVKFRQIGHKSGAEQIQNLLGGHISLACLSGEHVKYLKSGELKMIAFYNQTRASYAPDVKTLIEDGFNYYIDPYYYIAAPKGLPDNIKASLASAFDKAINSEKVKEALFNTFQVLPKNLGPDGTLKMMTDGSKDIVTLIEASK